MNNEIQKEAMREIYRIIDNRMMEIINALKQDEESRTEKEKDIIEFLPTYLKSNYEDWLQTLRTLTEQIR